MSTIETGGPAFPVGSGDMRDPVGMTLRDYFAAKAMQGIVAGVSGLDKEGEERVRKDWLKSYPGRTWGQAASEQSYHIADAMIKAREQ